MMKPLSFDLQAHMPGLQFVPGVGFVENGVNVAQSAGASLAGEADIAMISGLGADTAPAPSIFNFSQIPWWGWLAVGAAVVLAYQALSRR